MNNKQITKKSRCFVAIGYPESLQDNWIDVLSSTHLQVLISPLHDLDINPTGEPKKAHYHIMIMYESPHSQSQAQEIFDSIGATQCQVCNSVRGQARYLCHLDNQEKEQYNPKDVKCLNGVDYQSVIELPSDNRQAVKDIIRFINENDIDCFADIVDYAAVNNETWFITILEHNTLLIKEYIKSRTWKKEQQKPKI